MQQTLPERTGRQTLGKRSSAQVAQKKQKDRLKGLHNWIDCSQRGIAIAKGILIIKQKTPRSGALKFIIKGHCMQRQTASSSPTKLCRRHVQRNRLPGSIL